ncbi:MAG: arginine--tRNA ligase [Halobacteria archaeon]|nr:arginine--tRNA ligase [Halobacteria archaeon]
MFIEFRREVEDALKDALDSAGYVTHDLALEKPPNDIDADLASTVSFHLTEEGSPVETAEEIYSKINLGDYGLISGVETRGPYINFSVSDRYLERTLEESQDESYGNLEQKDEKIILEHTSANPTGPLHVGRTRNPIIGDSLARVLRGAGYDVSVEYYINDMGRQVATITWALNNLDESDLTEETEQARDKPDYEIVRYYREAHRILDREDKGAEQAQKDIDDLLQALEDGNEAALKLVEEAVDRCLNGQLQSLERLGASYDNFVKESRFVIEGEVDEVAEKLKQDRRCYEEEDAFMLDLSDFDIEKELVFLRSDGTSLYPTRDIAYHLDKFERCDTAINVLGEDHRLEAGQLSAALEIVGSEMLPEVVFYSYVNLPEGKMSTRSGNVVNMDDLLDEAVKRAREEIESRSEDRERDISNVEETAEEIGIGAVRFDIVSRQPEKPITFDWDEALNFEGQHAPYVQYVHARASGILEKADAKPAVDVSELGGEEELALMRKIGELTDVVNSAAEERSPHKLATYSRELAERFNEFYRECPVIDAEEGVREARLALTKSARNTIARSLGYIGVEAPEAM